MKNISIVVVLIVLSNLACGFKTIENFDIEPQKSKLVVFCELFNDSTSSQSLVISRTRNVNQPFKWDITYGDTLYSNGRNAVISCYNGPCIELDTVSGGQVKLQSISNPNNVFRKDPILKFLFTNDHLRFNVGEQYTLRITAPDFDPIEAWKPNCRCEWDDCTKRTLSCAVCLHSGPALLDCAIEQSNTANSNPD